MRITSAKSWQFSISSIVTGLLSLQILTTYAFGAIYYVSSAGSDSSNGASTSTPWRTISKVNSSTFTSGDGVYFRSGDTFLGQININQSNITLGSYGSGNKPVLTGAIQLTGWTVYSGSIYMAQASSTIKNLYSNGVQMTLARYPNTGFIPITSKTNSTTFTATGVTQASGYWNGANCRMKTTAWTFESPTVSTQTGTTIVLTSAPHYDTFTTGWGFYLDNKLAALDTAGEWYCDPSNNKVYFYAPGGVNPNTLTVYGSILDYGVNSSQSYITVRDLEFHYQVKGGLSLMGRNSSILSNTIYGGLADGIYISAPNCTISNNTVRNINGNGIRVYWGTNCIISNNTIKSIALAKGYQSYEHGFGIYSAGTYATISGNYIDSIGYNGITASLYDLVQQNIINNTLLTLCDGGAIYAVSYTTIQNNIISNVVGNNEGIPLWGGLYERWKDAMGIYLDGNTHNCIIKDNTIIRAGSTALYLNYGTHNHTIRNNTCYGCASNAGGYFLYVGIDATLGDGAHTIMKNVFYPASSEQTLMDDQDFSAVFHSPGIIDSNYYLNPHGKAAPFETLLHKTDSWSKTAYTFAQWQATTGLDSHSKYIIPESYKRDTIFVNSTASPVTVNLPPVVFYDLDNNSVVGSFILSPYSSKILIRDTVLVSSSITVSPTSLSFGDVTVSAYSDRSYTLSGSNLTPASGNIVITAPSSAFQVSLTSGSGFSSSLNMPYTGGKLSSTTIYVRFSPTAVQSYTGNITNTGNATTKNVMVTGTGTDVTSSSAIYGNAVNATELTGYKIDNQKVSFRFRAKHTGPISGIRVFITNRQGNGGKIRASFRNDSTSNHTPSQSIRTYALRDMKTDTLETHPLLTFVIPSNIIEGNLYHIVFENLDPSPSINYSSVYTLTMYPGNHLTPEQPFATDVDWNSIYATSPYTTWNQSSSGRTPIMEYYYTDDYSAGMGNTGVWLSTTKTISGNSSVRETFTVSGNNINVSSVAVWLRRVSGNDSLTARLEKANGTLLEQGSVTASSISTSYAWVKYTFKSTQSLIVGQSYNITFTAPSSSNYDTYAIYDGGSTFTANARFADGYSQFNTGNGWTGWDQWGKTDRNDGDLMFYFSQASTETPSLTVGQISSSSLIMGTLTATQQPLSADGGAVILQWTSQNADSASISPNIGTVPLNGSQNVYVTSETQYILTLFNGTTTVQYSVIAGNSTTSVRSESSRPNKIELKQNYPNPFNPSTVINYQLSMSGKVRLAVYDMLGREVAILVDGERGAGYYSETFDGSKLSSGIYFTRFVFDSENGKQIVQTRKISLAK